jgi:hypothetical protein
MVLSIRRPENLPVTTHAAHIFRLIIHQTPASSTTTPSASTGTGAWWQGWFLEIIIDKILYRFPR